MENIAFITGILITIANLSFGWWLLKKGGHRHASLVTGLGYFYMILTAGLLLFYFSCKPVRLNPLAKDAMLVWIYGVVAGCGIFSIIGNKLRREKSNEE